MSASAVQSVILEEGRFMHFLCLFILSAYCFPDLWYFKLYYLPLLICLCCLTEFSWCLLASLHVSRNTNFRATKFNEKRCWKEIVAVCWDMLCYKQTVYVKCTALFSYSVLSYAGTLSAWVLSNLLFLFLHASPDSERGKLFSFFHFCVYPSGMHWKILYWFTCISEQKLSFSE